MYTALEIKNILQCEVIIINKNTPIKYLVVDSRRISFAKESIFFALKTATRDGQSYIEEAYEQGVRNFVVQQTFDTVQFPEANFFFVANTLLALQQIATFHRQQFNYPVIGITGSNGKTIVKEWLYQLLSEDYNIVRSPRSYNSQIGVPLSVWEMKKENNLGIFEAGISEKNEMHALQKIIQPTIGILTNIGEAHSKNFKNNTEKLTEKLKLFTHSDVLFTFFNKSIVQDSIKQHYKGKVFSIGNNDNCTLKILQIRPTECVTNINLQYNNYQFKISVPFIDFASVENILVCTAVMLFLQYDPLIINQKIQNLQPIEMRMQVLPGINNCTFINDSYSLDIYSLEIALDFLSIQPNTKTVLVSDFPNANEEVCIQAIKLFQSRNINRLITIGTRWKLKEDLLKKYFTNHSAYLSTDEFIDHFNFNLYRNETLLIKGARTFEFEKIIPLFQQKIHSTFLEVNLNAIVHNIKEYRKFLQPNTKLMAMVKAFGYGSGSLEIASLLQFHKVDYLTVAYTDEAVELKEAGIQIPIMIMNIDENAFERIVTYNLEPEIFSFNILDKFINYLKNEGLFQYPIHIKIDTGMHRLGFEEKDIPKLVNILKNQQQVQIKSVFSHFVASEDISENNFTVQQYNQLGRCIKILENGVGYSFLKHISNSAGIIQHPELQMDMVRLGIGLYGLDSAHSNAIDLLPAISFKTTIAQIREVKVNDTVGYNRKGKLLRNSKIATIRVGYADGFKRSLSNGNGYVFIKGKLAPVVGIVCMDMAMIDVTDINNIDENAIVEIFGTNLSIEKVAQWCNTNAYEILTGVGQRVKRVYTED